MPSSAHPNAVAAVCKVVDGWDLPLVYSVQGGERIKGGETTTMSTLWSRPTRFAPVPSDVVKVHWLLRQRKGTSGKKAAFDVLKYRVENERFIADPRSGAPTAAVFDRILRRKRAMRGIMSAVRTDDESKLEPPEGLDGGWSDLDDGSESSDDDEGGGREGKRGDGDGDGDGGGGGDVQLDQGEILDVEGYLVEHFVAADADGNGRLDGTEFTELLRTAQLGLEEHEVQLLHAVVAEGDDGIAYEDFVPLAMDLINACRARAQARLDQEEGSAAAAQAQAEAEALEAVRTVHAAEIEYTANELEEALDGASYAPPHVRAQKPHLLTRVTRDDLKEVLMMPHLRLAKHEISMTLAELSANTDTDVDADADADNNGGDTLFVDVSEGRIKAALMQARVQSLKHAMLLRNRSDTEKELTHAFTEAVRSTGAKKGGAAKSSSSSDAVLDEWGEEAKWASLPELRGALEELKHPLLSSMQVVSLMSDAAALQRESDGRVDVARFAPACAGAIDRMFDPVAIKRKAALCARAEMEPAALMRGMERAEVESELGELFSRFDADGNGVLDKDEFMHLLDATSLGLEPHDIAALYDTADADNDGTVDYAEFMKVAFAVLVGLAREKALRQIEEEGEEEDDSDEEEGDGGASD